MNEITREDGTYVFGQLFPGDYYLHSQLKEYEFTPSTQSITIPEGSAITVTIECKRIAWSVYGSIHTITGQPLAKQRVIAISSTGHKESSVSDKNGEYRIRGLHDNMDYTISLMNNDHCLPKQYTVMMKQEDCMKKDFVILHEAASTVTELYSL